MSKKTNQRKNKGAKMFKFGDVETALNDRNMELGLPEYIGSHSLLDSLGVFTDPSKQYYVPPVPKIGLGRLLKANAYHGAIPEFKTNITLRNFIPSKAVDFETMYQATQDFMVFNECYFYMVKNWYGEVIKLEHVMAVNMRVKVNGGYRLLTGNDFNDYEDFNDDEIIYIKKAGVLQNIYGDPSYLGALQSILLNEEATIFRRKFYINGAHAGYIFYINDPNLEEEDEDEIKRQLNSTKGVGNFKALFLNIPNGDEKAVQIIPIGDFSSKDDLKSIKDISRDDIIAAWRIHPALANIIPSNTGGYGDYDKIDRIYYKNEIIPIQQRLLKLNDYLPPDRLIGFDPDLEPIAS